MLKKVLSLILCLCICVSVVFAATSCGESSESDTKGTVPTTVTILGITSDSTTPESVKAVEDAINIITKARYKTQVKLNFVTEDEYFDLVNERIELAKYYENYDAAIATYNAYMRDSVNGVSSTKKVFGNWIKKNVAISVETIATRDLYLEERTTVHPDGTIETLYPESLSPIDIVMIANEDMYDYFNELGILVPVDSSSTAYKSLQKYIYPTYFTQLKALKGNICAIPNNNMLAEYTYLLVDKTLADKYDFNIGAFSNYADLSDFLAKVKANEKVVPFAEVPEALGIFKLFSDDIAIGTYFDPINGYDEESSTSFNISNLFEIPEYTNYLKLMDEYKKAGYFDGDADKNGYAVKVINGDASLSSIYSEDDSQYYIKVIQNPFVLREAIFDGMFAVTSYTSDKERSMEIIEAINTDAQVKNLLQYGIEGTNYIVNEDDTVTRLNSDYMMDNALTGNVYMGHLEEGMAGTSWAYVKQTNLASLSSPFLIFPVDEAYLESNLNAILTRTALSDALEPLGISYEEYMNKKGTSTGNAYSVNLKNYYKTYFLECLKAEGIQDDSLESVFSGNSHNYQWYEAQISNKIINEKYVSIKTAGALKTLINTKMYESIGVSAENYTKAASDASDYYANIESLRILSRITLFPDMTDEEYDEKYGSLSGVEFENAILEYVRANYIEKNNINESDYEELVKSFISSQFSFYNSANERYSVTWEQFEDAKKDASDFAEAMNKIKAEYNDVVLAFGYTQEQIDVMNDVALASVIHDALYYQHYSSLNFTKSSYEEYLYNEIFTPLGISYSEFTALKRSDPDSYNKYLSNLKKHYKKQLRENLSKDEYESLSNTKLLSAILDYFIEDYSGTYAKMCETAGISYSEYKEYLGYMETYVRYVTQMKSNFLYTLRTLYTDDEINSFSFNEIEKNVYDAVYNYGYYTNEMAKYVGMTLDKYMNAKSSAVKYNGYISSLVSTYSDKIEKLGYDVEKVKSYNPEDIEDIIYSIVEDEYFSEYKSVEATLAEYCASYIAGISSADDIETYCKEAAEAINSNSFFASIVAYLDEQLESSLS